LTRNNFLILGLGYFGAELAEKLYELGASVVAVDANPAIVASIANKVTQAIEMNPADEQALESLGVSEFDICVIARGSNLEDSVSIAITLKELGAKYIIGRTVRRKHGEILLRLGVNEVIFPEIEIADFIAEKLVSPKMFDKIELKNDYVIELIEATNFWGKKANDYISKMPKGTRLIAIHRDESVITDFTDLTIEEDDLLLVWGTNSRIWELEK